MLEGCANINYNHMIAKITLKGVFAEYVKNIWEE